MRFADVLKLYLNKTKGTAKEPPAGSTIVLADGTTNTIKSTGTLDINRGGATAVGNSYGIYVDNDEGAGFMTISGSTVTASAQVMAV